MKHRGGKQASFLSPMIHIQKLDGTVYPLSGIDPHLANLIASFTASTWTGSRTHPWSRNYFTVNCVSIVESGIFVPFLPSIVFYLKRSWGITHFATPFFHISISPYSIVGSMKRPGGED